MVPNRAWRTKILLLKAMTPLACGGGGGFRVLCPCRHSFLSFFLFQAKAPIHAKKRKGLTKYAWDKV